MDGGMMCLQDTAFAKTPLPPLLVQVDAGRVHGVEGARIADVQFVGRYADDGACG